MAMSVAAGGKAGRRRRGGRKHRPMSEINMTPFIDVMLVLLIIFMVAAPLLTAGVPLDLMETPITLEELVPKLQAIAKQGQDERIYVRGDKAIAYGKVAEVMAVVTSAGYRKVALVTEPEQKK